MMTSDSGLTKWKGHFQELDRCPWPGPRPLSSDDETLLVGRQDTRKRFRETMQQYRLILLHGPSGVGKTSLLQAGLIPDLLRRGSKVFSADQWGGTHSDTRTFLASRLGLPIAEGDPFEEADALHSDRGVLVLDQFEELVRYSPDTARQVFDVVLDLNRRLSLKVVISFRSEYLHEFTELEGQAVNFSVSPFALAELDDVAAEKVILAATKTQPDAIDPAAAAVLADAWTAARRSARAEASADDPFGRVGLLHLQAMLYALYFANDRRPLLPESVAALLGSGQRDSEATYTGATPFRLALQQAVATKIEHCDQACRLTADGATDGLIDDYLTDGTRWMLARIVGHLSSAGYKLIRGAHELAHLAMGVDHEALVDGLAAQGNLPTAEQERALFEAILDGTQIARTLDVGVVPGDDLLGATRAEIATRADRRLSPEGGLWEGLVAQDPAALPIAARTTTCGPMMNLGPADVMVEEFRRYAFAIVWLHASSLIRLTTPRSTGAMVSLIHDGFGTALMRWAETARTDPSGPLSAITAPRGASFAWSSGPASLESSRDPAISGGDVDEYRFLPNLRWRGGWVQADFERVAFLNCDFRGTLFDGCRLTGVTFVNCLLDGAIFSDCVITGRRTEAAPEELWSNAEPDFVMEAPQRLVSAHAAIRASEAPTNSAFLCQLPGAPAVPYQDEPPSTPVRRSGGTDTTISRLRVEKTAGGIAIYGGRVSSLVFRSCLLSAESGIALRHTTGSGLEFVELKDSPGLVEIFGSALRHVTFSSRVGVAHPGSLCVRARESALIQVWVGPELRGSLDVTESRLIHAWNGSPSPDETSDGVRFTATDCTVHGLLDVQTERCKAVGDGPQIERAAALQVPGLASQLRRMDYRRDPSRTATDVETDS